MAESTRSRLQPSSTDSDYFIWQEAPASYHRETLGKWLVFKHKSKIDETWETVRQAVASGELGATGAKVSTMKPNPTANNPDVSVICVYTTREDVDEVGLKLIQLVRQKISYKTDEATLTGRYTVFGHAKVTCRTLQWNKGNPVFTD